MRWAVLAAFIVIGGLISALLNGPLRLSRSLLFVLIGAALGLAVTTFGFQLPEYRVGGPVPGPAHPRRRGYFEVLVGSVVLAAAMVVMSRLLHLRPPYLYGLLCSYRPGAGNRGGQSTPAAAEEAKKEQEAKLAVQGLVVTLTLSVGAACLDVLVRRGGPGNWLKPVLDNMLVAVCSAGICTAAFALVPLPFLPGRQIMASRHHRWRRWLPLQVVGIVCFVIFILGPQAAHGTFVNLKGLITAGAAFLLAMIGSLLFLWYCKARFDNRPADGQKGEEARPATGPDTE